MNKDSVIVKKADSSLSRIEELEKKLKEAAEREAADKKRMEELEAKIAKDKEAKKKRQEETKADKAELAALKKALNAKKGEIDILADCMISLSAEKPQGWSRKELLACYLAALGIDESHEKSPLKAATLNAQCGARIQPRLEKLGFKIQRAASDMGAALYIAAKLEK